MTCAACASEFETRPVICPNCQAIFTAQKAPVRQPERPTEAPAEPEACEVEFPWGVVRFERELPVGRDPDFSPIADELSPFGTVSRSHARLVFNGGTLYVLDEHSSQGTFVDGERLIPGQPVEAPPDATIYFSGKLIARVRVAAAQNDLEPDDDPKVGTGHDPSTKPTGFPR